MDCLSSFSLIDRPTDRPTGGFFPLFLSSSGPMYCIHICTCVYAGKRASGESKKQAQQSLFQSGGESGMNTYSEHKRKEERGKRKEGGKSRLFADVPPSLGFTTERRKLFLWPAPSALLRPSFGPPSFLSPGGDCNAMETETKGELCERHAEPKLLFRLQSIFRAFKG